jgi:hypothetical protein
MGKVGECEGFTASFGWGNWILVHSNVENVKIA